MLPKRVLRLPLERRLSPATEQPITSARRLQICSERLIIVALSLWLAGCNNQQPAPYGLPPPGVTVSKPGQKGVVDWIELSGRPPPAHLSTLTPCATRYPFRIPLYDTAL